MSACRERAGSARDQCGFALIALLALAALFAAFLIASTLDFTATGNARDRQDRSMDALRKAKAALIAYAANEQWQTLMSQATDQPGALPCPDINHDGTETDEGNPDCVGLGISNTTNLIGRIPWKALGVEDLRDASGERLWYALSFNFRKLSGTTIINSDTQACDTPACNAGESQLTVTGTAPASNVVAIVFAPGQPLDLRQFGGPLQTRPADHTNLAYKNPINYLENFSLGDLRHYTFTTNAIPGDTFNDRLLVITQAELMAAVEPVVAARIERDIGKGLLQDYFAKWGRYPFAMPFVSPPAAQGSYLGVASPSPGTTMGLLPVTNTGIAWTATVTSLGTGTGRYEDPTKTISPNPTICSVSSPPPPFTVTCTFSFNGCNAEPCDDRPDIRIDVALNASMLFADIPVVPAAQDLQIYNNNIPRFLADNTGPSFGYWSAASFGGVPQFVPTTSSFVLQANGALLSYAGRLQNSASMSRGAQIVFQLPATYLPRLTNPSGTNPNIAWFISNQWYRQTYYAMALGYAPGVIAPGNPAACNPPTLTAPPCLTVNNLPGTTNNKRAILIFAGRALDGQDRVGNPGTLANYLEGQNATPNDLIFEHRTGGATTINDRVVVVSP